MKKLGAIVILLVLFSLSISSEWSLLTIGEKIGKNPQAATVIIQGMIIAIAVGAIVFLFSLFTKRDYSE